MAQENNNGQDRSPTKKRVPKGTSVNDGPALEARNLTKTYDKVDALIDASFSVNHNEVFGLLGSNGAGKTTALKVFAGLIRPTSGQALVLGRPVMGNELFVKANIGYLPETPTLYETMTGYELLDLIATLRKMDEKSKQARISYLAKVLELDNAMDQQLGTYSKGMKQKIAFAQAVIHRPKILLLDEPTAGLDPRFGKFFKEWIKDFGRTGTTVLMNTHLTLIAEEICDRVAVINRGRILTVGTVAELKEKFKATTLEDVFVKVVGGKDWRTLLPSSL